MSNMPFCSEHVMPHLTDRHSTLNYNNEHKSLVKLNCNKKICVLYIVLHASKRMNIISSSNFDNNFEKAFLLQNYLLQDLKIFVIVNIFLVFTNQLCHLIMRLNGNVASFFFFFSIYYLQLFFFSIYKVW